VGCPADAFDDITAILAEDGADQEVIDKEYDPDAKRPANSRAAAVVAGAWC